MKSPIALASLLFLLLWHPLHAVLPTELGWDKLNIAKTKPPAPIIPKHGELLRDGTYIYQPGLILEERKKNITGWEVAFRKDPDSNVNAQRDIFFRETNTGQQLPFDHILENHGKGPGFYYIRYFRQSSNSLFLSHWTRIMVPEIHGSTASPNPPPFTEPPAFPPGETDITSSIISTGSTATFILETIVPQQPNARLSYTIENYEPGQVSIHPPTIISPDGTFSAHPTIQIKFNKPGPQTVKVSYGNFEKTHRFHVLAKSNPLVILLNSNDSNKNNIADFMENLAPPENPENIPLDHEIIPLNLLAPGQITSSGIAEMLEDNFFVKYDGWTLEFRIPNGLRLWKNQQRTALENLQIPVNNALRDSIRRPEGFTILVEGIQESIQDGDQEIALDIINGQQRLSLGEWPVTVLHLYINHSKSGVENHGIDTNLPVNQILNPAIIPLLQHNQPNLSNECALFEIDSTQPELLKKYAHLIEWKAVAASGNQNHLTLFNTVTKTGEPLIHGAKTGIYGTQPDTATISVRLTGGTADYLSFQKPIIPIRNIPLNIQFFLNKLPPEGLAKIGFISQQLPHIISRANIIGRQAGIQLLRIPAPNPSLLQNLTSHLQVNVEDFVFRNIHPTGIQLTSTPGNLLYNIIPNFPANIPFTVWGGWGNPKTHHLWTGQISPLPENNNIHRINLEQPQYYDLPLFPITPMIMRPHLPFTRQPSDTLNLGNVTVHLDIPKWITDNGGWAYASAIAYRPGCVNLNLLPNAPHLTPPSEEPRQYTASAIADIVPPPEGLRQIAIEEAILWSGPHPASNTLRKLLDHNIATIPASYDSLYQQLKDGNQNQVAQELLKATLRTLGLQHYGQEEFYHYQANFGLALALNQALEEKSLLDTEFPPHLLLAVNPISPKTEPITNEKKQALYKTNLMLPPPYMTPHSIKLNSIQAQLLQQHPFIIP